MMRRIARSLVLVVVFLLRSFVIQAQTFSPLPTPTTLSAMQAAMQANAVLSPEYAGIPIVLEGGDIIPGNVRWTVRSTGVLHPGNTFADEFASLSLHRTWQSGDKWGLIATATPDGRGGQQNFGEPGDQWWVNPFNPNTLVPGGTAPAPMYQINPSGTLQLELTNIPSAIQSAINSACSCTNMAYLGTLLNNQNTNLQFHGFWQFSAAVDRVPGLVFQMNIEDYPAHAWTSEIDMDVWTDSGGVQYMTYDITGTNINQVTYSTSSASGFDARLQHMYGFSWDSSNITFYIDGVQVAQVATPTSGAFAFPMFTYLLVAANFNPAGNINNTLDPSPGSLPAYAHLNCFEVYTANPNSYTCHH